LFLHQTNHPSSISTLEYIIARALGEEESGVVDIRDVEFEVLFSSDSRGESDIKIDDTVGDGFTVDESVVGVFVNHSLGER
jgi:hypothetical protein